MTTLAYQTGFQTPVIMSSGRALQILAANAGTGLPEVVTHVDHGAIVEITINGRVKGGLVRPFSSGLHEGILYFLPDGCTVYAGDEVTFSATAGFFRTSLGYAAEAKDIYVVNHSLEGSDQAIRKRATVKAFADHVRDVSSEFSSVHGKRLIVVDESKLKAFLQATE